MTDRTVSLRSRRVLGYHEFSVFASKDVYHLTPTLFAEHLEHAQYAAASAGQTLDVTFDDAHCSQIEFAAPMLEQAGLRGTFFVPTARVGVKSGTATWPDLRALAALGHVIGSHGDTHTFLTQCSPSRLEQEVRRSRADLQDQIGQRVNAISMPGGRWNRAVAEACRNAGYDELFTSEPNGTRPFRSGAAGVPLTIVGRLVVRRTIATETVAKYAAGDSTVALWFQAEYRTKQLVKKVVGDSAYQTMWQRLFRKTISGASI